MDKLEIKMTSTMKILLFIPLLQLLHISASSSLECGLIGNCESVLLDLSITSSLDGCVISGQQVQGAKFVSWNSIANICEAYATCEEIDDSEMNSLTSSVECYVCNAPGLCLGHVVDDSIVDGEEECEQLCINEETCTWFSFLADQQFCLLLDDCSSLDTTCSNCHTSMKTCLDYATTEQPSTTTSASVAKNKLFYVENRTVTLGKNQLNYWLNSF